MLVSNFVLLFFYKISLLFNSSYSMAYLGFKSQWHCGFLTAKSKRDT